MILMGPLPCKGCRQLVTLQVRDGIRQMVTQATGSHHACEGPPRNASWRELLRMYGEEGAIEALAMRSGITEYRQERIRRASREAQRRRRAAARQARQGATA